MEYITPTPTPTPGAGAGAGARSSELLPGGAVRATSSIYKSTKSQELYYIYEGTPGAGATSSELLPPGAVRATSQELQQVDH